MSFEFSRLDIPDIVLIEADRFVDERGFFMETYKSSEFSRVGIPWRFAQDNLAYSVAGVLRGLHYQKNPASQGKLVAVIQGEVFDVGVDLRRGSPTYGQHVGEILSAENRRMIYVPEGFAHGYCVTSEHALVWYKATYEYSPVDEGGIIWDDASLAIDWPVHDPILSPADASLPAFSDVESNFVYERS